MRGRAVVFDCDGVLVDSEEMVAGIWVAELARRGVEVTAEQGERCRGRTDPDCYAILAEGTDLPPFAEFDAAVRTVTEQRYRDELQSFPDAVDAASSLAFQGIPLAVASSSPRWRLDLALEVTGLRRYFEATVAGDEVPAGKPAPDLYLAAAAGLGVAPSACLAIEDAAAGAAAAAAADMRVVVVQRPGAPVVAGHATVSELDPELLLTWL